MRSRLFIPPLANPFARLLTLAPVVRRLDEPNLTDAERRAIRQVARGLYESLPPAIQRAFRRQYRKPASNQP